MGLNIREVVEAQVAEKIEKGEALAHAISAAEEAAAALDAAQKNVAAARRDAMNAATPVIAALTGDWTLALFCLLLAALIAWRHQANIKRLLAGTEPKIGRKT